MSSTEDEVLALIYDLIKKNDFIKALKYLNTAITKAEHPDVNLHCIRGQVYLKLNSFRKAHEEAIFCLKLNSKFPGSHYLMGHVHVTKKDFNRALECFIIALRYFQRGDTNWQAAHLKSIASLPKDMQRRLETTASTSNSEGVDFMEKVPHEIVLYICSFLDIYDVFRMTAVCSSWYARIINEPIFWQVLINCDSNESFKVVASRSKGSLTHCLQQMAPKLSSSSFRFLITAGCRNLRELDLNLDTTNISRKAAVDVVVGLKNINPSGKSPLERLQLWGGAFLDEDFSKMLAASANLKYLYISSWRNFTGASLSSFPISLPFLEELYLDGCYSLGPDFGGKFAQVLGGNFGHLRIRNTAFEPLVPIVSRFKLKYLCLECGASQDNWKFLLDQVDAENLEYLWLISSGADDSCIPEFLRHCTKLVKFHVSSTDISDETLRITAELQTKHRLNSLYIGKCISITPTGMIKFAADISEEGFEYLDCSSNPQCITDKFVLQLSSKVKNLRYLRLSKNTSISGSGLVDLIKNAHSLQYLDLDGCTGIPDSLIEELKTIAKTKNLNIYV